MTDATIHNLPIKPGKLFLLRLEPTYRHAQFTVKADINDYRVFFEMDEDGDVVHSEGQRFVSGGRFEVFEDERSFINDALEGEARRMMKAEFQTWDQLTHVERIDLQIAWAQDLRKRTEDDFAVAVGLPFEAPGERRWDYESLGDHLRLLRALEAELDGLSSARSAL